MKLKFKLLKREEEKLIANVNGVAIKHPAYTYRFGMVKTSDDPYVQRVFGEFVVRSVEPLHFRVDTDYDVIVSDTLTIINKLGGNIKMN